MKNQILAQGAEAIITKINRGQILKNRIKKSYRIQILDEKLRKSRTRSELKIIKKLENIISVPKIIKNEEPSKSKDSKLTSKQEIIMEYIEGQKLSNSLESLNHKKIGKLIGENTSLMHNSGIIHGDLTTSNMIFVEKENKVYFIDFGLAFHSEKIEDKAVDLHLLSQALEAKHFTIYKEIIKIILEEYEKTATQGKEVIERIKK